MSARASPNVKILINSDLFQWRRPTGGCKPPLVLIRSHRLQFGSPRQATTLGPLAPQGLMGEERKRKAPRRVESVNPLAFALERGFFSILGVTLT
jgi:hypothetical protein